MQLKSWESQLYILIRKGFNPQREESFRRSQGAAELDISILKVNFQHVSIIYRALLHTYNPSVDESASKLTARPCT
jgi:hypothetical protein